MAETLAARQSVSRTELAASVFSATIYRNLGSISLDLALEAKAGP